MLAVVEAPAERSRVMRRLNFLLDRLGSGRDGGDLRSEPRYYHRILETK